jgi:hypothetical protein
MVTKYHFKKRGNSLDPKYIAAFLISTVLWSLFLVVYFRAPIRNDKSQFTSFKDERLRGTTQVFVKDLHNLASGIRSAVIVSPYIAPEEIQKETYGHPFWVPQSALLQVKDSSFKIPIDAVQLNNKSPKTLENNVAYKNHRQRDHMIVGTHSEQIQKRKELATKIFKSWAEWVDGLQIPYWLAHSTLHGHFKGQQMLPWDDEIAIQIPANLLYDLMVYNGSIISNQYRFEINEQFSNRNPNPTNSIDAKFIDINTDYFIEITGLNKQRDDFIGCKTPFIYDYQEIFPLKRTLWNGIPTWIPFHSEKILVKEIGHVDVYDMFYKVMEC